VQHSARWQRLYGGAKPDAATQELESYLRRLLKTTGTPTSITAAPPIQQGPLTRIEVRVAVAVRVDQLTAVLEQLQREPRLVRVESLAIQSPELQAPDANPTLTIQADIVGYTLTPRT